MSRPRVSVVMIVKNEEERLASSLGSLASLGPLLHEICIYDTGSSDATVRIARSFSEKVQEGFWDDDFARARNAAASMATGDWLLVVDADEQLICNPHELETTLAQFGEIPDAYYVSANIHASQSNGDSGWLSPRLYRPSRMRYDRPVHAGLIRHDHGSPIYRTIPDTAARLINSGFDHERSIKSLELKARLTSKIINSCDEGQADSYAFIDRGRARLGQGRLQEALADLRKAEAVPHQGATTYTAWAKELLIHALLQAGEIDEAQEVLERLEHLNPGRPFTTWLRGRVLAQQGRLKESLQLFSTLAGGIDGGLSPLAPYTIYKACLDTAIECEDEEHIVSALIALSGIRDNSHDYLPLLAKWWGDLPAAPLREALALSADRTIDEICSELRDLTGPAPALAARLAAASDSPRAQTFGSI